jgi:hypothetical protein
MQTRGMILVEPFPLRRLANETAIDLSCLYFVIYYAVCIQTFALLSSAN